ncbi:MAG: glycosyltransferase family 39 protein [Candidatus Altiarchaeota archaeon]
MTGEEGRDRFFVLVVLAALVTRVYALFATKGFLHPDNLYQLLEPAHRLVFGYGIIPWEYVYGMRSWFQPLMIAAVFKLGVLFGVGDILSLIFINRCIMVLFSLALLYVIYEMALALYGRKSATYALFFAVFSPILWLWSADVNYHTPSTLFATAALLLFYLGWKDNSERCYLLSGLSLGVAFMFRFDSLLFLIPLGIYALVGGRFNGLQYFIFGLVAVVLVQGVLDLLTWGSFLHSPIEFFRSNLLQGRSSSYFGSDPFYYYFGVLVLQLTCLFLLPFALERRVEFNFLAVTFASFLLIYSLIPHKEPRFMIPLLPIISIMAGRGMERMRKTYGGLTLYILVAATVYVSFTVTEAFGWQNYWRESEAMNYVGRQPDATGVAYSMYWYKVGGYTYLHNSMPVVFIGDRTTDPVLNDVNCDRSDMDFIGFQCSPLESVMSEGKINYIVTDKQTIGTTIASNGFTRVRGFGNVTVYSRPGKP